MYSFTVSLYSFGAGRNEEAMKSQQHHPVTKLSQLFDTLTERDTLWLSVARWEFCRADVSDAWCQYFQRLQLASWTLLSLAFFSMCCLIMGAMAGFCFHYIKPRGDLSMWATAYLLAAPSMLLVGLVQYYYMTQDFGLLIGEAGWTLGWPFMASVALAVLTWIPAWIMLSFAFRADEDSGDEEKMLSGADSDNTVDLRHYGAIMQDIRESMQSMPFFAGDEQKAGSDEQAQGSYKSRLLQEPGGVHSSRPSSNEGAPSEAETLGSQYTNVPLPATAAAKDPDAKDPDAKDPDANDPDAKDPDAKDPDADMF